MSNVSEKKFIPFHSISIFHLLHFSNNPSVIKGTSINQSRFFRSNYTKMSNCESKLTEVQEQYLEEHQKNAKQLAEAREQCLEELKKKDESTRSIMRDITQNFKETITMITSSNERNFKMLMTQMERQNERSEIMFKRMDDKDEERRKESEEQAEKIAAMTQVIGELLKENARIKQWKSVGENLMSMVSKREQELDQKYGNGPFSLGSNSSLGFANQTIADNQFPRIN